MCHLYHYIYISLNEFTLFFAFLFTICQILQRITMRNSTAFNFAHHKIAHREKCVLFHFIHSFTV